MLHRIEASWDHALTLRVGLADDGQTTFGVDDTEAFVALAPGGMVHVGLTSGSTIAVSSSQTPAVIDGALSVVATATAQRGVPDEPVSRAVPAAPAAQLASLPADDADMTVLGGARLLSALTNPPASPQSRRAAHIPTPPSGMAATPYLRGDEFDDSTILARSGIVFVGESGASSRPDGVDVEDFDATVLARRGIRVHDASFAAAGLPRSAGGDPTIDDTSLLSAPGRSMLETLGIDGAAVAAARAAAAPVPSDPAVAVPAPQSNAVPTAAPEASRQPSADVAAPVATGTEQREERKSRGLRGLFGRRSKVKGEAPTDGVVAREISAAVSASAPQAAAPQSVTPAASAPASTPRPAPEVDPDETVLPSARLRSALAPLAGDPEPTADHAEDPQDLTVRNSPFVQHSRPGPVPQAQPAAAPQAQPTTAALPTAPPRPAPTAQPAPPSFAPGTPVAAPRAFVAESRPGVPVISSLPSTAQTPQVPGVGAEEIDPDVTVRGLRFPLPGGDLAPIQDTTGDLDTQRPGVGLGLGPAVEADEDPTVYRPDLDSQRASPLATPATRPLPTVLPGADERFPDDDATRPAGPAIPGGAVALPRGDGHLPSASTAGAPMPHVAPARAQLSAPLSHERASFPDPYAEPGHSLVITDVAGTRNVVIEGTLVVGRAPSTSQVREPDARLIIVKPRNKGVSHSHVSIRVQAGTVLVRDLWSTNGTRVKTAGVPPFRLRDGEEVPVTQGTIVELGDGVRLIVSDGGGAHGE